jgi:hypothetical protein
MWAPPPWSELTGRISSTGHRHSLLQLQQLNRRQNLPHQNALATPRTEDHQSADAYRQVDISHNPRKHRLCRFRDRIRSVQSHMRQVVPMWLGTFGPGQTGCRQTIPLRNERRFCSRIQRQLHRLGHPPSVRKVPGCWCRLCTSARSGCANGSCVLATVRTVFDGFEESLVEAGGLRLTRMSSAACWRTTAPA